MAGGPPFAWRVGDHATVIGDTGSGKTYLLAKALLPMREFSVVFVTKEDKRDTALWTSAGYHIIRKAKEIDDTRYSRFVLQPRYSQQAVEGWRLFERVYRQGRWTIVVDEFLLAERLGLREQIERLLTQGRSDGITVVVGQQRPVITSRFALSQSTHVISFRIDGDDAKTLGERTTSRILPFVNENYNRSPTRNPDKSALLGDHEFVYYHRAARFLGVGKAQTLGRLLARPGDIEKSRRSAIDSAPASASVGLK
jgi:hypothetical protein